MYAYQRALHHHQNFSWGAAEGGRERARVQGGKQPTPLPPLALPMAQLG